MNSKKNTLIIKRRFRESGTDRTDLVEKREEKEEGILWMDSTKEEKMDERERSEGPRGRIDGESFVKMESEVHCTLYDPTQISYWNNLE